MSSSNILTSFDSGHSELIHDAQLDYYGRRLATASSDQTIRIFDLDANNRQTLVSCIKGHDGPVWSLSWAHPRYGCILGSGSYDGRVCVWREVSAGQFSKIYEFFRADSSVSSLSFAPHTFGLMLVAGLSDGTIAVLSKRDAATSGTSNMNSGWFESVFFGHKGGVSSVSWGPDMKTGALLANQTQQSPQQPQNAKFEKRFVSGGCDCRMKIWRYEDESSSWVESPANNWQLESESENHHADWIRDVSWAPSIGLPNNIIASCSEDKTVMIWSEDITTGVWRRVKTLSFPSKVWRVSWSLMGNILAVSQGDNSVSLWKESIDGDWKSLSSIDQPQFNSKQPIISTPTHSLTDGKLDF